MAEDSKKLDTIVDAVHSIDVRLAGMDSKLDVLGLTSSDHETRLRDVEVMARDAKEAGGKLADHESRMRTVERKLWMLFGFAAAVGTAGGTVVSQILK